MKEGLSMPKFMQTLDESVYQRLKMIAEQRGITIQELIRAVIIPEWLSVQGAKYEGRALTDIQCPICGKKIIAKSDEKLTEEYDKHIREHAEEFKVIKKMVESEEEENK